MIEHYTSAQHGARVTGLVDHSARPDAPVVASRADRSPIADRARAGLAVRLRRLATAVEPRPRPEPAAACR